MPVAVLAVATAALCAASPVFRWTGGPFPVGGAKGAIQLRSGAVLATRTEGRATGAAVLCSRSDDGRTWRTLATVISTPDRGADVGDGCLLERRSGELLYSYRDNRPGAPGGAPTYAIRVRSSRDGGRTWQPHSTVDTAAGAGKGLWSSFLFERHDGALQCYYDDEQTPWNAGFPRHQWVSMRTWDPKRRAWAAPTIVSRAHDPAHLSRDGMPSVVEVSPGHLLCVFESVQVTPPHAGVVRQVTSDDGGRTWSWERKERAVLYEPRDTRFAAYAPWVARLSTGELVCVFGTNEDRPEPSRSGSPPPDLNLDIKLICSRDAGRSWAGPPLLVYEGSHHDYMPGLVPLRTGPLKGKALFLMLDCRAGFWGRIGEPEGPVGGPRRRQIHPLVGG